jgi:AmmeMemoRadiSam system protein A
MAAEAFRFQLEDREKDYLKDLVRTAIQRGLNNDLSPNDIPAPPTDTLRREYGVFVTLKIGGHLRGCIGHIVGDSPLFENVYAMAQAAAFQDPRFPPLSASEFDALDIEISVLSPLEICPDLERIEVGRHGLLVQQGGHSGLLLPQVAPEWGWDRLTFLQQTCGKAGLPPNAYSEPDAHVFWFEAEVF